MSSFMSKLFKIAGVVISAVGCLCIIGIVAAFDPAEDMFFFIIKSILVLVILLVGLMLRYLGKSMDRMDGIENRLGRYILLPNDQKEPQIRCERCGKLHHLDVVECPYCKLRDMGINIEMGKE